MIWIRNWIWISICISRSLFAAAVAPLSHPLQLLADSFAPSSPSLYSFLCKCYICCFFSRFYVYNIYIIYSFFFTFFFFFLFSFSISYSVSYAFVFCFVFLLHFFCFFFYLFFLRFFYRCFFDVDDVLFLFLFHMEECVYVCGCGSVLPLLLPLSLLRLPLTALIQLLLCESDLILPD